MASTSYNASAAREATYHGSLSMALTLSKIMRWHGNINQYIKLGNRRGIGMPVGMASLRREAARATS